MALQKILRPAVEALRSASAARIAIALPVALGGSLDRVAGLVDHVICPMPPRRSAP